MDSTDCWIVANQFANNSVYGIEIRGASSGNEIYYNCFIQNSEGNAHDDGSMNIWDDQEALGNYWEDWNGNNYYQIPGDANSIDHYPKGLITESTDFLTMYGPTLLAVTALFIAAPLVVLVQKKRIAKTS